MKQNIAPVDDDGILERMSDIGVYTYDFIDGPADKLGLMAKDFHRVFGRGGETTINGQEVQMALWLAAQQLHRRTVEQVEQNSALDKRVAAHETRIVELMRRIAALESRLAAR